MGAGAERGAAGGQRQHPHPGGQPPEPRDRFRGTVRGRWSSPWPWRGLAGSRTWGGSLAALRLLPTSQSSPRVGVPLDQDVSPAKSNSHVTCCAHVPGTW